MRDFQAAVLLMTEAEISAGGLPAKRGNSGQQAAACPAASSLRRGLPVAWLAVLVLFGGCQAGNRSLFVATGPGWHVQQGQAVWRPGRGLPEFGGDVVLASDDAGRHLIQFDKTPMAILSAQTTSNRWLVQFPQRQQTFGGHGRGWKRFAWLYLPAALDGKTLPKDFIFERKPEGAWRLENTRTGEVLEGFLSP